LGGARLSGFEGQPTADALRQQLLGKYLGGTFDLHPDDKKLEGGLRQDVVEAAKAAAKAAEELAKSQGTSLEAFLTKLGELQRDHLKRLEEILSRSALVGRQVDLGVKGQEVNEAKGQAGLAEKLAGAGVKTTSDLRLVAANIPHLEEFNNKAQASRQERERFAPILSQDFGGLVNDKNNLGLHQGGATVSAFAQADLVTAVNKGDCR
jgi:hypothetical protein